MDGGGEISQPVTAAPLQGESTSPTNGANGAPPVTGPPPGEPLPPADTPMKPHLPPQEVSAVRDEEPIIVPAPATEHHLPSDDRATAAAASVAASSNDVSEPTPIAHPIAQAPQPDPVPSLATSEEAKLESAVAQQPEHEAEARGLNGSGVAGTLNAEPETQPVTQPISQVQESPIVQPTSAGSTTAEPATSSATLDVQSSIPSAPGTKNPYDASEENDVKAEKPILPVTQDEAPTNGVTRPQEDVEMKDEVAPAAPAPSQPVTAGDSATRGIDQDQRRPSTDQGDANLAQLAGPEATSMPANVIKGCQSSMKSLMQRNDAIAFKEPVDWKALGLAHYPNVVKNPMDYGTIDLKLALTAAAQKGGKKHTERTRKALAWGLDPLKDVYNSLDDFEADVRLVFHNCILFNGEAHVLSGIIRSHESVFEKQIKSLRASAAGEENGDVSISSLPGSRRQSEVGGGIARPKREIHPPPPKDLPYVERQTAVVAGSGSKSKAATRGVQSQLNYVLKVVDDMAEKNADGFFFKELPARNLEWSAAYYDVIKNPISLSEIHDNLTSGRYEDVEGPKADMDLLFRNCFTFNPPGDPVHLSGKNLQRLWEQKLQKLPATSRLVDEDDDDDYMDGLEDDGEDANAVEELRRDISKLEREITKKRQQLDDLIDRGALQKSKGAKKQSSKKRRPSDAAPKKAPAAKKPKASAAEPKKAPVSKPKPSSGNGGGSSKRAVEEEVREVTYEQKEELAAKITQLPDDRLDGALKIIAEDKPPNANEDEEIELDIDDLSPSTLYKLYRYVVRPKGKKVTTSKLSSSDGRKRGTGGVKRKNLDEGEEAARIARLQAQLDQFENGGAAPQPAAAPAGHDDLVASESSSGEEEYESESDYE